MQLPCGCQITPEGKQLTGSCRIGHSALGEPARKVPRAEKPPPAGATVADEGRGAVPPTSTAARKRAEAKESGRKLKAGRWRWNAETGECEAVAPPVALEDEDDG